MSEYLYHYKFNSESSNMSKKHYKKASGVSFNIDIPISIFYNQLNKNL